jgi:hypothetical protein
MARKTSKRRKWTKDDIREQIERSFEKHGAKDYGRSSHRGRHPDEAFSPFSDFREHRNPRCQNPNFKTYQCRVVILRKEEKPIQVSPT